MSISQVEEVTNGQFRFEDGEMVLSDAEQSHQESKTDTDDAVGSRKNRRKQTFERRNIKKVREDTLNDEAKAAQQAEMERRRRLEKDQSERGKFSNIEFLLTESNSVMEDCLPAVPEPDAGILGVKLEEDVPSKRFKPEDDCSVQLDSTSKMDEDLKEDAGSNILKTPPLSPSVTNHQASIMSQSAATTFGTTCESLFGINRNDTHKMHAGQTCDDAILLGDSDEDVEKPSNSVVIELSDGEDEVDDEDEPEIETEICELQDAANLADEHGRVLINPTRDVETEPEIYLSSRIARVLKPHQVSGIRFLYDNLIESLPRFNSTDGFGCILAHSMGLGKTIQIIGFLEAIFRHCNVQRVLVIVPINTIQNWQHEFEIWLPTDKDPDSSCVKPENTETPHTDTNQQVCDEGHPSAGTSPNCKGKEDHKRFESVRPFKLFVVRDVIKTMTLRHQIISQWFNEGGVLLLGYEMFRLLLNQKRLMSGSSLTKAEMRAAAKRKKKNALIDLEKDEKLKKMWSDFYAALLEPGPQLVICDEGHRIKNSEASISKALKAIKTRRRVVLTGYPLQNNLMEYWCMVDFVRPNYLGTKQEFTNMFQRPIENGQCIDSTPEDRKVMQGRAHVLHDLLSGFVQRRSHAVLKASLPPKTEIVLLVKLSPLQRRLYAAFMRTLNSNGPLGWAQVNTLKTYAMCCKIWNHPDILWRAMEEHKEALDFDIDDPTSSSTNSYSNRSMHRSSTTSNLSGTSPNTQLSSPSVASESNVGSSALPETSQFPSNQTNPVWSIYAQQQQQLQHQRQLSQFASSNPLFQAIPPAMLASHGLTSPPSMPNLPYHQLSHQQQQQQANAHTYDWATDTSLWGEDFQPGNVEHSGKILLFLCLLEGCVLAGDKLLVFTQSLYTLDLLERILRRLPLPTAATKTDHKPTEFGEEKCKTEPTTVSSGCRDDINFDIETQLQHEFDGTYGSNTPTSGQKPCTTSDQDSSLLSSLRPLPVEKAPTSTSPPATLSDQTELPEINDPDFVENLFGEGDRLNSAIPVSDSSVVLTESNEQCQQQQEETLRSLHYRLASRLTRSDNCTVWTKNVHYFRLDGSTTASEREKLINNFNDPSNPAKLFLVSTRAGCLGVNLIGANRVVVFDASWNPCHDCQAVCRVYRYGQVKACHIYRLVSDNTMEKKIYDRQVTKQGMSDRVVDELNPLQQFTRSQVELLMSFEDKDMPTMNDQDVENCTNLVEPDPVLASILEKHKSWITKIPFTHESLLIDHKDYRLTRVEKRLARQRYEQEKRLSLSYQRAHLIQYQNMQLIQQQQLLAAGINPSLVDQSRFFGNFPNIFNRGLGPRPTYTSGMAAIDAMRQVQNLNRNPDCKVTRVVATSDLFFPSSSGSPTDQRKIPKGEELEVIQTPKGKYLRIIRTGDLFVVKSAPNAANQTSSESSTPIPTSHPAEMTVDLTEPNQSQLRTSQHIVNDGSFPASTVSTPHASQSDLSTLNPNHTKSSDASGTELRKDNFNSAMLTRRSTVHSHPDGSTNNLFGPSVTSYLGHQSNESSSSTGEFAHPQPSSAPASVLRNNSMISFDQQQQHYPTQHPQSQDQQSRVASWSCSTCGRSILLGCTCRSADPTATEVDNRAHNTKLPSEDPHKATIYPHQEQYYESNQMEAQAQLQQRQEQYLRAAEQAARQSAAAYANFTRQQLAITTAHSDIPSAVANQSSVSQQSAFQGSTAAAVHDYFAQLTNNQAAQQKAMMSLQNAGAFSQHTNPMAAAVQQYLSGGRPSSSSSTASASLTTYPTQQVEANSNCPSQNDPNHHPLVANPPQSQSSAAFFQPPTGSNQASTHSFDRLQSCSQPLIQNFRFS